MRLRTLLVVLAALLAVSAMPASAQNASAVASQHTTFGTGSGEASPTSLQNMTVEGSGESASVVLGSAEYTTDSFEDGDISEYGGDTGGFSVGTSQVQDGSRSLEGSGGSNIAITSTDGLDTYPDRGENYTAWIRAGQTNGIGSFAFGIQSESGWSSLSGYLVTSNFGGSGSELYNADDGSLNSIGSTDFETVAGQWYRYELAWGTDGSITISIYDDTGALVGQINATDNSYTDGGIGWHNSGDSGDTYYFDAASVTGEVESGTYIGPPHDAEAVAEGWTNLTLSNVSATVTWQADPDGDGTWTNVSSTAVASTTNVTQDLSGTESDRWRVRADFEVTGSNPTAELHDEGLLFASASPSLSDVDPTGQITDFDGDISINVSDADLGLAQGDTVVVDAETSDGTQIGQQSVTSNGTVTFAYDAVAGENEITWTASDEYGNSDSVTQTFTTPSELTLYNETSPETKIQTGANITATFFGENGDVVIQRTSADATFDFSGLPADTQYIVTVDAEGYRERTTSIRDLYEQQSFYLLSENESASQVVFELSDPTGEFPPGETRLYIEKPLKINGTTEYRTIAADSFGATAAYSVILADGSRYRLRIRHDDQERILGSYTVTAPTTEPLRVDRIQPSAEDIPEGAVYGGVENGTLAVRFRGGENDTTVSYEVTDGNGTVVVPETETTGASFAHLYPVTNSTATAYNVSYTITYGDGTTEAGSFRAGGVAGIAQRFNIDPQVLSLLSWVAILSSLGLVVIVDKRLAPAVGTGVASALTIIGTVAIPAPLLGVAGAVGVASLLGSVR